MRFLALLLLTTAAHATTLRFATAAPEGTAWAREFNAYSREVARLTDGQLTIKWYFGAIAGEELQVLERIRRGQLDGAASGGPMCEALAPSLRALRVLGLLVDAQETTMVLSRLREKIEAEVHQHGFVLVSTAPLGPHIIFSRKPVRSIAELREMRFWVWDMDDVLHLMLPGLGVKFEKLKLAEGERAYLEGRIDGFIAPASVALAFQWSALVKYVTDLRLDFLTACIAIDQRAFDPLPDNQRRALMEAGIKTGMRVTDVSQQLDSRLMGGLFTRQGVTIVPVSESFRSEFYQKAEEVREQMKERLPEPSLVDRVLTMLADFRIHR
jgi:TRAP-type C4-dicarboxylate transport system substrate-binding protein